MSAETQSFWRVRNPETGATLESVRFKLLQDERRALGWPRSTCPVERVDVPTRLMTKQALQQLQTVRRGVGTLSEGGDA